MDLKPTLRPVDRVVILFNAAIALLWLGALGRVAFAPVLLVAQITAAAVPYLTLKIKPDASSFGRGIRELYPIVLIVVSWTELGLIRELFHAEAHDALIASLDLAIFGQNLQAIWMPAMPDVWFSETMFAIYFLYYPMVFGTPLIVFFAKRWTDLRDIVFRLTLAYLACFAIYVVFPVEGPSHSATRYVGDLAQGFFYRLSTGAVHAGDSLGTAFPSSHVVGVVTMALLALTWFSRPVAIVYVVLAAGVTVSTVYTQNHFAVDAAAGVVYALVLWALVPIVAWLLASRNARAPKLQAARAATDLEDAVTRGES
ncbi:MAG: phosphatase PAP2 family protein [Gemmatimonadota bacterium]|nr:phosphatase PAP2 family protein [Gemmatimonadota bacterium]MDH3367906.1 phosphatase PAP2 family protein [Gemmatimonadota bacterium]MDH3477996.1 phosphatase PAP2 family protein [Gemmatimonadota bacterium]MDH5549048.1 phosphatase PAP2 family protein [Gemmatimonadota bacterium]